MEFDELMKYCADGFDKFVTDCIDKVFAEYETATGMTLKETVDKQIPMEHHHTKVSEVTSKIRESICPSCLHAIFTNEKEYPQFCTWCGQKIKWDD